MLSKNSIAPLAQLVEQRTLNPWVRGSIPWRRIFFTNHHTPSPKYQASYLSTHAFYNNHSKILRKLLTLSHFKIIIIVMIYVTSENIKESYEIDFLVSIH